MSEIQKDQINRHDAGDDMFMTSSCSVMVMANGFPQLVEFRNSDYKERPEDRGNSRFVEIARDDWEQMGCPDTITVTIEPGDMLNV